MPVFRGKSRENVVLLPLLSKCMLYIPQLWPQICQQSEFIWIWEQGTQMTIHSQFLTIKMTWQQWCGKHRTKWTDTEQEMSIRGRWVHCYFALVCFVLCTVCGFVVYIIHAVLSHVFVLANCCFKYFVSHCEVYVCLHRSRTCLY